MDEQKTLLRNDAFLGTGWSFPPVLTDTGVQLSRYEQDIRESLHVLFSTAPGEAGPPHLYRGAHQQPPQHGLSLLPQRRDQYRQCIT